MWVLITKIALFTTASTGIAWASRHALRNVGNHRFYRFFAGESILILFLMNVEKWFSDPFSLPQIISWLLLLISLYLVCRGRDLFRRKGRFDRPRSDASPAGKEGTAALVTTGVHRYIRHPVYSALLFLGWGIFLKNPNSTGFLLALVNTLFLTIAAKLKDVEKIEYFGKKYWKYMQHTQMFVPFFF